MEIVYKEVGVQCDGLSVCVRMGGVWICFTCFRVLGVQWVVYEVGVEELLCSTLCGYGWERVVCLVLE